MAQIIIRMTAMVYNKFPIKYFFLFYKIISIRLFMRYTIAAFFYIILTLKKVTETMPFQGVYSRLNPPSKYTVLPLNKSMKGLKSRPVSAGMSLNVYSIPGISSMPVTVDVVYKR